jgi:L-asparaginase type I
MNSRVRVLTTGGTIASRKERGVAVMNFGAENLVSNLGLKEIDIEVRDLMRKGSMEMDPRDWQTIARATARAIRDGVDGVVVMHGTDTMQYTASALSFMLRGLGVPVVLTGSMIPGGDPESDSLPNLRDAIATAAHSDIGEVCIVFSADNRRSRGVIIRGCRARKMRSQGINAFESINVPPLGYVEGNLVHYNEVDIRRRNEGKLKLVTALEPRVVLLKLNPAVNEATLAKFLRGAKGAILEGTGVGHVKTRLHRVIRSFGRPTVMTTQAPYGGERLGEYDVDRRILGIENLIPGRDMCSETALVKLMWTLPQGGDARSWMLENIAGEISGPA